MSELFENSSRLFELLPRYVFAEDLLRRRRVLELQCGDGVGSNFVLELEARLVCGLDADPDAVSRATEEFGGPNLEFQTWTPPRIDFPDSSFDMVLALRGVADLGDIPAMLREVLRVLSPDGLLLLASANPDRRTIPDVLAQESPGEGEPGYYDLYELLTDEFPHVRMVGQSPFLGFSLVEFAPDDPDELGMSLDDSLLEETEDATTFLALCGRRPPPPMDFSLIQLPYFELLDFIESLATEEDAVDPALLPAWTEQVERASKAVMTTAIATKLRATQGSAIVRQARTQSRAVRRSHARLLAGARRAAARTRRAAHIAGQAKARAEAAEKSERSAHDFIESLRATVGKLKIEKLGMLAETRKELKEREDRISELLQKLVKFDGKVQKLEAQLVDKDFEIGNIVRDREDEATQRRESDRSSADILREVEGLRAALAEARSAPAARMASAQVVQDRDRRIAELSAEIQAMEWRVEEAVGEAIRLQAELGRRDSSSAA